MASKENETDPRKFARPKVEPKPPKPDDDSSGDKNNTEKWDRTVRQRTAESELVDAMSRFGTIDADQVRLQQFEATRVKINTCVTTPSTEFVDDMNKLITQLNEKQAVGLDLKLITGQAVRNSAALGMNNDDIFDTNSRSPMHMKYAVADITVRHYVPTPMAVYINLSMNAVAVYNEMVPNSDTAYSLATFYNMISMAALRESKGEGLLRTMRTSKLVFGTTADQYMLLSQSARNDVSKFVLPTVFSNANMAIIRQHLLMFTAIIKVGTPAIENTILVTPISVQTAAGLYTEVTRIHEFRAKLNTHYESTSFKHTPRRAFYMKLVLDATDNIVRKIDDAPEVPMDVGMSAANVGSDANATMNTMFKAMPLAKPR